MAAPLVVASMTKRLSRIVGNLAPWVVMIVAMVVVVILVNHYFVPVIAVN
jgi:antibiotic biosynthesis monooxygenase (ABM) superfamily enzyme